MQSQGVDWWGYAEGDSVAVGLLMAGTAVFAIAFFVRRVLTDRRGPSL